MAVFVVAPCRATISAAGSSFGFLAGIGNHREPLMPVCIFMLYLHLPTAPGNGVIMVS